MVVCRRSRRLGRRGERGDILWDQRRYVFARARGVGGKRGTLREWVDGLGVSRLASKDSPELCPCLARSP